MSNRFALLVGVNRYPFASRAGLPDRRAPENDVEAWQYHLDLLGFPRANVRALSTASGQREPDTGNLMGACHWFIRQLALAGPGAQGVVVFAGHGDARQRGALYLSDFAGTETPNDELAFRGQFDITELAVRVRGAAPGASLLAVVDDGQRAAGAATSPRPDLASDWNHSDRALLLSRSPGDTSYERTFCGRVHGQLTWAVSTLLTQWQFGADARQTGYPDLSMGSLAARAAQLMAAISPPDQPQQPCLYSDAAGKGKAIQTFLGPDLNLEWHADFPMPGEASAPDIAD